MEDPTLPLEKLLKPVIARDDHGRLLPGQPSINPFGRPKRKTLTELIHEKLDKGDGELNWDQLVSVIISMAKGKDKDIVRELWHYTDGKPKESLDIQAKGDFNVTMKREP